MSACRPSQVSMGDQKGMIVVYCTSEEGTAPETLAGASRAFKD